MDIKIGDTYNFWTVIKLDDGKHKNHVYARCHCGTEKWVYAFTLINGKSKSCGCRGRKIEYKDYGIKAGDKIGCWTVLATKGQAITCRCVCGTIRTMKAQMLLSGRSTSCGCKRAEKMNKSQIKGKEKGHALMKEIQSYHLAAQYFDKKINSNSSTGFTGVSATKNKKGLLRYRAYIMVDRKQISLGMYDNIEDAVAARKIGEEKYFLEKQKKVNEIKRRVLTK